MTQHTHTHTHTDVKAAGASTTMYPQGLNITGVATTPAEPGVIDAPQQRNFLLLVQSVAQLR